MKPPVDFPALNQAKITYFPGFYPPARADELFEKLKDEISWEHQKIKIFGKSHWQPRLTALYGDNERSYSYSNLTLSPKPFPETLVEIKRQLESFVGIDFTSCLANFYRDGQDSNGWHADDEPELGQNPIIASLSFGAPRRFKLRRKDDHRQKCELLLASGSLLLMRGETQHFWQHQIPKTKRSVGPRINLTFRIIRP